MKILITGDVSTNNIENFDVENINKKFFNLIKESDLVVYNLEGPIATSDEFAEKNNIQFREQKLNKFFYNSLNLINTKLRNKPQIKVYSNKKILSLLKLNSNTLVALANNHIKDLGKEGFNNTIKELEENKVNYIGAGENINNIKNFYEYNNIVFINLNYIGSRKFKLPLHLYSATKTSFGSAYFSYRRLKREVERIKKLNKKIVLIIHGGKELAKNYSELNIDLEKIKNLKVDLSVIHHPHLYVKTNYENDNIFVVGDFIFKSINDRLKKDRNSVCLEVKLNNNDFILNLIKFKVNDAYEY